MFSTQTFDYNYHDSFTRGVEAYVTAEANVAASSNQSVDVVREAKFTVEAAKDKQFFFDDNSGALALPFTFAFLPFNDDVRLVSVLSLNFNLTPILLSR